MLVFYTLKRSQPGVKRSSKIMLQTRVILSPFIPDYLYLNVSSTNNFLLICFGCPLSVVVYPICRLTFYHSLFSASLQIVQREKFAFKWRHYSSLAPIPARDQQFVCWIVTDALILAEHSDSCLVSSHVPITPCDL